MVASIPRLIHQTWKNTDVPSDWLQSQDKWIEYHTGWSYRLWTDNDLRELVKSHYSDLLEIYDNFEYNIQRVDLGRTLILHKFGGIYCDLDVVPSKSFEAFINYIESQHVSEELSALAETPNGMGSYGLSNFLMVSTPGARLWQHYWNYIKNEGWSALPWYLRLLMRGRHYKVMLTTGPTAISTVYNSCEAHVKQNIRKIPLIYIGQSRGRNKQNQNNDSITDPDTLFSHIRGKSWTGPSTTHAENAMWVYDNRDLVVYLPILLILIITVIGLSTRRRRIKKYD